MTQKVDTVTDDGRSKLSDLWKKEDYWAIWLGIILLTAGYIMLTASVPEKISEGVPKAVAVMNAEINRAPFHTVEYYQAMEKRDSFKASAGDLGKEIAKTFATPGSWSNNPVDSFIFSKEQADAVIANATPKAEEAKARISEALAAAKAAQAAAEAAGFQDAALNTTAEKAITDWRNATVAKENAGALNKLKAKPRNVAVTLPLVFIFCAVLFGIGMAAMGHNPFRFALGFVLVFIVAVAAFTMGAQSTMKQYGIGAEAWAIIIGMLIANTVGTPKFAKPALQVEFFIKTGLVLLGAEVLFDKIVAIGIPGIFVAWVVTPIVLISTFIFGQKVLKMPSKTLNITISADMSVCGTSAAIATAAACRAKKEELTLSIGLSLVFTAIMMVAMPAFIKAVGMPEILGGAWIGGTVDATGAVAAAGAFLGDKALYVAATIKMIQNILIGVTAFGVAVYWCTKVDCVEGQKVRVREIWDRFPKFVLGFLATSIVCSMISGNLGDLSDAVLTNGMTKGWATILRNWFFALAFTAIGLATNFRELAKYFKGGKPLILYVCGQSFNLVLTLTMAYIMFYLVFPEITAKI